MQTVIANVRAKTKYERRLVTFLPDGGGDPILSEEKKKQFVIQNHWTLLTMYLKYMYLTLLVQN